MSRRSVAVLVTLFVASLMLVFAVGAHFFPRPPKAATGALPTSRAESKPGRWGDLEIVSITMEPPVDFAARFLIYDTSSWYFRDCTKATLPDVLAGAGFPAQHIPSVVETATPEPRVNGVMVKPPLAAIFALSPEQRLAVCEVLAREPANYSKTDPFRFRGDAVESWLDRSGLCAETVGLVRRLIYRRGDIAIFSDVSAVVQSLKTESEKVKLFRALARQSACRLTLRVGENTDTASLIRYWGKGQREQEIAPLLEAASFVPGGDSIGITELLPAFARRRVFQFPVATGSSPNSPQDCHWTSMNFWNETPDDRFSDPVFVAQTIGRDYVPVTGDYELGDVLFLVRDGDSAIHSAVYVAADVVFTKNGGTITSPWMLMRMSKMLAYYSIHGPVEVRAYRKKS